LSAWKASVRLFRHNALSCTTCSLMMSIWPSCPA
jgi:hypothetical protein